MEKHLKEYRFVLIPRGDVPQSKMEDAMQAGYEEVARMFRVEKKGLRLVCSHKTLGLIQSPQQKDRFIQLFMEPQPLEAELRLFDLYVKYFGVSLPYKGIQVVQDPAEIFCQRWSGKECTVPIYIICHPQERSVTLSVQIIEPESLVVCREIFFSFQQGIEGLLVASARMQGQLQS